MLSLTISVGISWSDGSGLPSSVNINVVKSGNYATGMLLAAVGAAIAACDNSNEHAVIHFLDGAPDVRVKAAPFV